MAKILVVDDSSLSRRILRRILEPAGHQISEAQDGLSALEQYGLDRPDLVLLDLTMTGMHGLDVLCKLRELDRQANVIVATADIQSSSRHLAEAGGARGFLAKPFSPDQVLSTVNAALPGGGQ
jgi:two-component system, chemotaxis family, chemotaxis protein CheY